jgi:hypothetical protein
MTPIGKSRDAAGNGYGFPVGAMRDMLEGDDAKYF